MRSRLVAVFAAALLLSGACATLRELAAVVQPPRFEEAPGRDPEIRLLAPAVGRPLGGAAVRLWTRVSNPNPFGFTLDTLRGTLFLDGISATDVAFPLGLPLEAGGDATVPIDVSLSFEDLPRLVDVVNRAIRNQPVTYRLDGTIGVQAARYGTPTFGPMTLLRGTFGSAIARTEAEARKVPWLAQDVLPCFRLPCFRVTAIDARRRTTGSPGPAGGGARER